MSENSKNRLPCPFCGGEPELKPVGRHYGASCADWKCKGTQGALIHLDAGSAISAWNRGAAKAYSAEKSLAPEGGEAGGAGVLREHRAPASFSVGGRIQFANVDGSAVAKDAERWRWARTTLMSMTFLSGRHHSGTTSVCPCDDDITSQYWDKIADRAIAASAEKREGTCS
jgi:hypothetical protein